MGDYRPEIIADPECTGLYCVRPSHWDDEGRRVVRYQPTPRDYTHTAEDAIGVYQIRAYTCL